ncbi:hypothetical protein LCGC14_2813180, partial [marine sediment metagenome]
DLTGELKDPNSPMLAELGMLVASGAGGADPAILARAVISENEEVRKAAAMALFDSYGQPRIDLRSSTAAQAAVGDLVKALGHPTAEIRLNAVRALVGFKAEPPEQMIPLMLDPDQSVRGAVGDAMRGTARSWDSADGAAKMLPAILKAVKGPDQGVRKAALKMLESVRSPAAVDTMISLLRDSDVEVVEAAARALSAMRAEKAVDQMLKILANPKAAGREKVAQILYHLAGADSIPGLVKLLTSGDDLAASTAARILARLKDPKAVAPLLKALQADSLDTRVAAAHALGKLGDKRAVEPLIKLVEELLGRLKAEVAKEGDRILDISLKTGLVCESLGLLGDQRAVPVLQKAFRFGRPMGRAFRMERFARAALLQLEKTKTDPSPGAAPASPGG